MNNPKIAIKHIIIALVTFIGLFILIKGFSFLAEDLFLDPKKYFGVELEATEINIFLINTFIIIVSVLISYIVYLLLSSNTRAELITSIRTKDLYVSLEQLRGIYEGAPVPYITLDKKGNILDPNKAALRFFGVVSEEIEGKNLFHYQSEEDLEKAEKLLQYYKSDIPINREEVKMITKSGKVKWSLLSVFKMEGPTKMDRAGLATIFDITEEKELDKAKTEFVSLASHQLQTPTATIKWFLGTLLSGDLGPLSPKQQDYLERIYKVNNNTIELVETLLNISRMEISSITTDIKSVQVPLIIESILFELGAQIESKQLNIIKEYNNNLENIKSDPRLLRIVVNNVLSNAVKYTPSGGTISITLKESFGDKSIIISDNGVGIPENDQNKIFSKLFRADNVRKLNEVQGTGLGLYLVKSIIETLGGSISFVSKENKGSAFTIKI